MEKKTSKNILLAIMGVLIVVEIFAGIIRIPTSPVAAIVYLISLVFTAIYGFWFYKKPHGNMLKYAMLIFAATTIISSSSNMVAKGELYYQLVKILATTALCYCAGRLNRIDQNKYLLLIIGFVFLGTSIYRVVEKTFDCSITLASAIRCFSCTTNYLVLMIAYFVRYDEHKEAGLMDAPKE